ncbi:MAG: DNA-directed RNA polymerase subunit D [Nanoarchaeota archaeon]
MDVKLLSQTKDKVTFRISRTDYVFVNTLRRLIMEEVPTLVIEDVNFIENSSALYDEMIALRLGLLPLKTDLKSYVLPEKAKNESDPRAFLNLKLKTKGPCTVFASDLQSQDPKIGSVYKEMIIVKLLKDQKLEFEATAILGKGKRHMKFSPALVYYHNVSIVNIKNKDADEFKNKYPSAIFDKNGKIDAKLINSQQLIDACKNINPDIIEVKEKEDEFDFIIESWGQLSHKAILEEAFDILAEKIKEFDKLVDKIR